MLGDGGEPPERGARPAAGGLDTLDTLDARIARNVVTGSAGAACVWPRSRTPRRSHRALRPPAAQRDGLPVAADTAWPGDAPLHLPALFCSA
jgi:hypothetical protein